MEAAAASAVADTTSGAASSDADVVMSGWLEKHSVSAPPGLKNWRRRVLTLTTEDIYWKRDLHEEAAGKLRLDPSTSIKVLPSHLPPKCISIISASGTLSLRFDNDEALQSWAKAIENVCKGKIQTSI